MSATSIEERVARLEAIVEHQADTLDEIAKDVKSLTEMANRGKGAIALLIAIGGIVGTIGTLIAERLFGGS